MPTTTVFGEAVICGVWLGAIPKGMEWRRTGGVMPVDLGRVVVEVILFDGFAGIMEAEATRVDWRVGAGWAGGVAWAWSRVGARNSVAKRAFRISSPSEKG